MNYLCQWSIDVEADSPEQAALIAEDLMALRIESAWNVHAKGMEEVQTIDTTIWMRALVEAVKGNIVIAVGWQYDEWADDGRSLGYCPLVAVGPALVHTVLATIDPANFRKPKATRRTS